MGVVINLANDDAGLKLLVQEGVCQQVVSALGRRGFTTLREVRILGVMGMERDEGLGLCFSGGPAIDVKALSGNPHLWTVLSLFISKNQLKILKALFITYCYCNYTQSL